MYMTEESMNRKDFDERARRFKLEQDMLELGATVMIFSRHVKASKALALCASMMAFILYVAGGSVTPDQSTITAATLAVVSTCLYLVMSLSCLLYNRKLQKIEAEFNIIHAHE